MSKVALWLKFFYKHGSASHGSFRWSQKSRISCQRPSGARSRRHTGDLSRSTRSPDGRGYRPKVGVARLALESGVSVVPVGQIGTDLVQPLGTNRPHLRNRGQKITIRTIFGKPLDFSGRSHEAHLFSVQREIADRVGVAIRELSGQEYVDVYADAVKKTHGVRQFNRRTGCKPSVCRVPINLSKTAPYAQIRHFRKVQ